MERDSISPCAGSYGAVDGLTCGDLIAGARAAGYEISERQIERMREDGFLEITAMASRGWAEGRFAVYDANAMDIVVAISRLRRVGIKKHDLAARLVLEGHSVPSKRLLEAMAAGASPFRGLMALSTSPRQIEAADHFVAALERNPSKRAAWGFDVKPNGLDAFGRDLFDDMIRIVSGTFTRASSSLPTILRRLTRMSERDEAALKAMGMTDLLTEFRDAAARAREATLSLDEAAPSDAERAADVLRDIVRLRDTLHDEGSRGNVAASILSRGLSIVNLESAFGLFFAYVVGRMIDDIAASNREEGK